jgi:hypothetical protein
MIVTDAGWDAVDAAAPARTSKRSPDERSDIREPILIPAYRCAHAGYLLSQPYLPGSLSRRFAALTTVAFVQSGPRWLGISDPIAEPEGPTFISYKVARSRLKPPTLRDTRPLAEVAQTELHNGT